MAKENRAGAGPVPRTGTPKWTLNLATFSSQRSFEKFGRKSRRDLFLEQTDQVVPWSELLALVEPYYSKAGNGQQPVGLAIILRTYFLQQWFGFSDPDMEEAFYDSSVLRCFAGVDLG